MSKTKTTYDVTPTPRQERAFENLQKVCESTGNQEDSDKAFDSQKEALMDAGYSESTAEHPKRIKESAGFQAILKEMNFTKEDRMRILSDIAHDKQDKRATISAIREANKMMGDHAPTKYQDLTPGQSVNKVIKEISINETG